MPPTTITVSCALIACSTVLPIAAAEPDDEMPPSLRLAVARGLEHLARTQSTAGDFDSRHPVAANALAGLAFLAAGHTEQAGGPYTEVVRRATSALLRRQNGQGYFDDDQSQMYGHGFATLYFAELYGTSAHREKEVRQALASAIKVIEGSQVRSGAWDYSPAPRFGGDRGHWSTGDTSITICQTMALRAAKNLGIVIDGGVIQRATTYIQNAQNDDGGFRYRPMGGIGPASFFFERSAFARSSAGVCILYSLGNSYNTDRLRKGLDYLYHQYRLPDSNEFPMYGYYYCSQAMFQAGGKYWAEYFKWVRNELVTNQKADGSWPTDARENPTQTTAMALIILELPYRYLPILER